MTHLTSESWRRLRAGLAAPDERAALLPHLTEPCDDCDELPLDDLALDAAVDHALARLVPRPAEASLVLRRVEGQVLAATFPRPRRWRTASVAVGVGALAAMLVVFLPDRPSQREKGDAPLPPSLTALVAVQKGGRLEPLTPARAYPNTGELFFTYVLPRDAHVYLARVGVDGVVEPFYPPVGQSDAVERAGSHALTVGGTVHGYSLEGLRGRQRFVVLTAPAPLSPAAVVEAVKSGAAPAVEVEVEGW